MSPALPTPTLSFPMKKFIWTCLIVSLWVNVSEVLRYFLLVRPTMQQELSMVPEVAPMNLLIFSIWGLWDTLLVIMLVLMYWLMSERWGSRMKIAVVAGTASWMFFFVLFWVGMVNMKLASVQLAVMALPWAWIEMVIASLIAKKCFEH